MHYNYRYRLKPTGELHKRLAWTVDTCRQIYNHFLHRFNRVDDTSAYSEQSLLPDLKREWTELKQVHSKVLQKVVQRLYDNLSTLTGQKENGYRVGELKWKGPQEYRSITYSQSGHQKPSASGWQPEIDRFLATASNSTTRVAQLSCLFPRSARFRWSTTARFPTTLRSRRSS